MTILLNRVFVLYYILIALLFRAVTPEVFSNLGLLGKIVLQCKMKVPHPSVQSTQGHGRTERKASLWIKKLLSYGWLDFTRRDKHHWRVLQQFFGTYSGLQSLWGDNTRHSVSLPSIFLQQI